jgi:hypothetical protein
MDVRRRLRVLAAALCAVALGAVALVVAAPDLGPWGDGLGILQALGDMSGANPRVYHLGYGALARAAVEIGAWFGLAHEAALIHLSRAALLCGAWTCVVAAQRRGGGVAAAALAALVALASPSLWFFAGVVEVHAVQFMGSAVALALALEAGRARAALPRYGLLVAAAVVALALHLSHLLLVPALLALACPARADGRLSFDRSARGEWYALAALAVVGALVAVGAHGVYRAHDAAPGGVLRGLYYLGLYEHLFLSFRGDYGWFGPLDVLAFLADQALAQGGVVWLAAPLGLLCLRGRERVAFAVLLAIYLVVVPQSGIRERGGYFASLFPWFVVLGAGAVRTRGQHALLALLLVPQLVLGWRDLSRAAQRPDARAWARAVAAAVETPCTVWTGDMVRLSALPLEPGRLAGLQWNQQFEFTPQRNWDAALREPYQGALEESLRAGRVYLDAEIVAFGREDAAPWQAWARALLDRPAVELVPCAEGLLVELRIVPR